MLGAAWNSPGANCFLQLLVEKPWTSYLISLCRTFLIDKWSCCYLTTSWVTMRSKSVSVMWPGLTWQIICATLITDIKPRASAERSIIGRTQKTCYREEEMGHANWTEGLRYANCQVLWSKARRCGVLWTLKGRDKGAAVIKPYCQRRGRREQGWWGNHRGWNWLWERTEEERTL